MKESYLDIVYAHGQPLFSKGIQSLLSERPEVRSIKRIDSIEELVRINPVPDLFIVDYLTTGFVSIDNLPGIVHDINGLNILIVSSDEVKDSIVHVYQAGIKGFISQDCSKEEFWLAVQAASKGERFFSSKILDVILNATSTGKKTTIPEHEDPSTALTARETEILKLLAQGQSTQMIADFLFLSPHTVQTHRKSIIRKLKIKSPTEFVIHALDMGLMKSKSF